jgi:hypothetical protein
MSPELSLFLETWNLFVNHVHVRERLDVAESLLEIFEDHVDLSELEIYKNEFDRTIKSVIASRNQEDPDDDDEQDDWG